MEEDEDIKNIINNNDQDYEEYSINELVNELEILKKKINFHLNIFHLRSG